MIYFTSVLFLFQPSLPLSSEIQCARPALQTGLSSSWRDTTPTLEDVELHCIPVWQTLWHKSTTDMEPWSSLEHWWAVVIRLFVRDNKGICYRTQPFPYMFSSMWLEGSLPGLIYRLPRKWVIWRESQLSLVALSEAVCLEQFICFLGPSVLQYLSAACVQSPVQWGPYCERLERRLVATGFAPCGCHSIYRCGWLCFWKQTCLMANDLHVYTKWPTSAFWNHHASILVLPHHSKKKYIFWKL